MNLLKDFIKITDENEQKLAIYHIYAFYSYFFDKYHEIFSEYKKDVQDRLNEILKLAKFKISSYLLWKDAVTKSHKQLNSVINKYKTILELPFEKEILEKHWESYSSNIIEFIPKIEDEQSEENRYETLCIEIFSRLKELKETADHSIKRKALSDLFITLKETGFSQYYKKWDSNNIYEMPILKTPSGINITKHEKYFYGCIDKMTILQYSSSKNHELLPEEKEKCLNFASDMLNKLIVLRSLLASEFELYYKSITLSKELQEIISEALQLLKSASFYIWQAGLENNTESILPVFQPTFTLLDLEPCIKSLNLLSKTPKFEKISLELLRKIPQIPLPEFFSENLTAFKSLGKLSYVIYSIFLSLFTQGFCLPVETVEEEGGGDGTGLGEGRGKEDITNELEDEEQFGEKKNQEENKDEMGEGEGMEMREEFKGEEESAKESEGEDRLGEAEGNEMLMDKDQEVRDAEGEVRETANPEMADQQDIKDGILPEDRQGDIDIEDFEMKAKISEDEEENLSQSQEEEMIDVNKNNEVSSDDEAKSSDNEENDSKEEEKKKETDKENEEKNTEDVREEENDEFVEKKLDEFKNRETLNYDKEAYGNKDLKANTEKMIEGGEGSEQQGCQQSIISKMKGEWNQQTKGPSEIGPESTKAQEATLSDIQIVNSSAPIDAPEMSSLYTFNDSFPDTAPAPSMENSSNLPPVSYSKTTDMSLEISESEPLPDWKKSKLQPEENYTLKPALTILPFTEGSYYEKSSRKNRLLGDNFTGEELKENEEEKKINDIEMLINPLGDFHVDQWHDLEKETEKISQELCEQLRIILEPTKEKCLKGDYRTGKRINMKKVIAYIASQYRKDKIWLRRTRETGREYQVLIAIDDSFSMNQHGLGQIAKKGLAAISQALNKLEVGELAVAAIRQGLTLLHDFSSTFTAEQGAYVLSELNFLHGRESGNDLCYPNFVTQCQEFLAKRGSCELQLVIVISDGRMNKQKVRPCLRKSEGIFYLFIIVDNQDSSILDMKSTNIEKVAGKSQVKVYPYLEDFPFEYYVVVQNSEFLVGVLADVIKQWFELLRS